MDQKVQYQDFEPFFEWAEDEESATLIIMLPGFRKDQMKVQVTSTPLLRINGEREINQYLRRRFTKEFPIPPYCDTNNVSAKFERGMLYIKFPKLVVSTPAPNEPQEPITTNPPEKPQATTDKAEPILPMPPNKAEPEPAAPPKEKEESISDEKDKSKGAATSNEIVANGDDQKLPNKPEPKPAPDPKPEPVASQKDKQPISDEKYKKEIKEPISDDVKEKGKELAASKLGAKMAQRLKTRVVDFTLSLKSSGDGDYKDANYNNLVKGVIIKRPKILINIIVAILLVMVLGTYVKNAFRSPSSSSSSYGGPNFQEL